MSEKQAKRNKKITVENETRKAPVDKSTILSNVIITIVILAVLGLGVYAVGSKYMEKHAAEGNNQPEQTTVADFIEEKGMTFDEFKTEYGLENDEEVTEESSIDAVAGKFTLENYAKYTDITLEELKTQYGLGDDVANTTTWQDAMSYMTTGIVAEKLANSDFETFKTQMGLPDTITEDTLWGEAVDVMNELYQQQQAAADENADSADTANDSPETDEAAGE